MFIFELIANDDVEFRENKGNELRLNIDLLWSSTVDHTGHNHWICQSPLRMTVPTTVLSSMP